MKKLVAILGLTATLIPLCLADQLSDTMRSTAEKYRSACVELIIVVKISIEGESINREVSTPGFLVDQSGLIVTLNHVSDPLGSIPMEANSKIVSVRIRTFGGGEVEGKLVLRDPDQNCAFVRPVKPLPNPFTPIPLSAGARSQMGDAVFTLGDVGALGNHVPRVTLERVASIVEKPRFFYVLQATAGPSIGSAAFNEKGEFLGLVTLKQSRTQGRRMPFNAYDRSLVVIVTAEDLAEGAAQAKEAKAEPSEGQ